MLKAFHQALRPEAGCDEAGRGCLCGPVFAAAVIFPENFTDERINDSKQLSQKKREELRSLIENNALAFAVASVDNFEIDKINILNASIKAMHFALGKLSVQPAFIIADGNRFKAFKKIPHSTIIQGDGIYLSIAAASILAKTYRDAYLEKMHEEYPNYQWNKNKGYATLQHREAIQKYGATPYHRQSFTLLEKQLKFDF